MDRYALIVAPYSTGAHYAAAFRRHGVRSIAVDLPAADLPQPYRGQLDPTHYQRVITHHDLPSTLSALRGLPIAAVVAGTEIGVIPAARLAAALGLPGNDPEQAGALRNKGEMARAWADAGIDVPLTLETASLDHALSWVHHHDLTTVVVKPPDAAGSDGLRICHRPADLRAAWAALHRVPNILNGSNEYLLVQEYLDGPQFVINTVTTAVAGHRHVHTVTERWADHRTRDRLYDRLDLLHPDTPLYDTLTAYAGPLLDALGVCAGPAHTEVVLTRRGLRPIETGARPEGAYPPDVLRQLLGTDHVAAATAALLTDTVPQPEHTLHVAKVSLIATAPGTLNAQYAHALTHLPTIRGWHGDLTPGRHVPRTVSLPDSAARLVLAHTDPNRIDTDYATVRRLETDGLYDPATWSTACTR